MTKTAVKVSPIGLDPSNVNARLYQQVSRLLAQLEEKDDTITLKERVAALIAIGRLQQMFIAMRKGIDHDAERAGSAVQKYSTAFSANAARRGKEDVGPALDDPEPDDWFESDDGTKFDG
jgi:hypothetical protein